MEGGRSDVDAGRPEAPVFEARQIRSHMTFLADDVLQGREAGTRGYELAALYVAANFERLGVEPAGDHGTYFNEVTLQETRIVGHADMQVGDELLFQEDFAVYPFVSVETTEAAGEAVFVGFGIEAPTFGINDYEGIDARGKVVVAVTGGAEGMPDEERSYFTSRAAKATTAASKGASAIVFVGAPSSDSLVSFERRRRFVGRPTTTWVAPDGTAYSEYGGIQVAYVSNDAAARLFAGAEKTYEEIRREAEAGEISGFDLPIEIRLSQTTARHRFTSPNVVGVLRGRDSVLADEYVVLSAHLDHVGVGRPVQGDSIYNGTLDNSAGVSVLLEVARAFGEEASRPRRSLLFLALTAEEKGLLGSELYAAHPTVPKEGIVANVNLDMPLLLYDFIDVVAFGAEHSTMGETVADAASQIGVRLSPDPMPEERLFTRSDHYSFVKEGVPSVFLVTGFANGGEQAFNSFLQSHYHRPSDEISLLINFDAGAKFALLNYLIARNLANADEAPSWKPDDFFGETFGTK